jgi:hypothetical protein
MRTIKRGEAMIKNIKPFFYAVADNEGNPVMDEICCCESPDELAEYFQDRIDDLTVKIVPVYTAPQIEKMREDNNRLLALLRESREYIAKHTTPTVHEANHGSIVDRIDAITAPRQASNAEGSRAAPAAPHINETNQEGGPVNRLVGQIEKHEG